MLHNLEAGAIKGVQRAEFVGQLLINFCVQCIFIAYRISNAFLLKLSGAEECVQ